MSTRVTSENADFSVIVCTPLTIRGLGHFRFPFVCGAWKIYKSLDGVSHIGCGSFFDVGVEIPVP